MALSKDLKFLKQIFIEDPEYGERTKIYHVEGNEHGHDHLRIYTQTPTQKEDNLCMLYKVFVEETKTPVRTESDKSNT